VSAEQRLDVVERLVADRPLFHTADTTGSWLAQPSVLRALARHLSPGDRTLEVGCGASTVVFTAMGGEHTAISVDAAEHDRVREYLDRLQVDHSSLNLIEGMSDRVLPTIADTLDVALIDGDHTFPYPAVDWHYVNRMLRVGGVLMMDDVQAKATGVVCESMSMSPNWELLEVIDSQAAAFRKLADGYIDWQEDPFSSSPAYWFIQSRFPRLRSLRRRLRGRSSE